MKLYYSPGACSMASHIALNELGVKFEIERVDLATKKTEKGNPYLEINAKGYVPALRLDSGEILTESGTILQYLSDQKPELQLMPRVGTMERYRCNEWLNFVSTEIHKGLGLLWTPNIPEDFKTGVVNRLSKRFDFLSQNLQGRNFLMGANYTVVDAYLFTILNWTHILKIPLTPWPALMGLMERVKARPAVMAAMKAEGLIQG